MQNRDFRNTIRDYYLKNRREMPWRNTRNPYRIFVSEVMLQQTGVSRVVPKYLEFIKKFPNFESLAASPLRDVLAIWKGLGYNRRALNLKRAAEVVTREYGGKLPKDLEKLAKLPGIGRNTTGAILAYAFGVPAVFIETNIRSVFIHHFFPDQAGIHDTEILPLIERTLDRENPREWYYALMDYGAMLKKTANPNLRSLHYARQSPFKGSRRQMRAKILDHIVRNPGSSLAEVSVGTGAARELVLDILAELLKEGFIFVRRGRYAVVC